MYEPCIVNRHSIGPRICPFERRVMRRAVDRAAAAKRAGMLADDGPILADHDAIRIGLDLDRVADRARSHRIFVVVEAHQASLGD
jgi:hypothetical protein